jgi:molybdenum cofactor cytidylyltransferase
MPVAALILAAGASRRLGRPKQLLEIGGETLLARAHRIAVEAGAAPVVTVLGAYFIEIGAAIPQGNSIRVFNEHWKQGIATSIHAGLRALSAIAPKASGALLMTCDQPRLTADRLHALLGAFDAQQAGSIVASFYSGVLGVPAIFPRSVFPRLLRLRGDQGARALLLKPPCPLVSIDFPGGEIDIDTPSDLTHLT